MKTRIITTAMLLVVALAVWAGPVGPDRALAIASDFMSQPAHRAQSAVAGPLALSKTVVSKADNCVDFYVFNRQGGNGFVVVSGDDACTPVLAYSDHGSLDMDDLPANAQWWLEQYQEQLLLLRSHPEWAYQPPRLANSVSPLLATTWNQNVPYNVMCPTLNGDDTYTGCVATAVAQIMKYYNYPDMGSGSETYEWGKNNNSTLSCTFNTTYEWNNMLDTYAHVNYSVEQAIAVGTLMRDVGHALHMNYGSDGSSAPSQRVVLALYDHFDYDGEMQIFYRNFYKSSTWDAMLRAELDKHRPIYYSGQPDEVTGGHAFVFDGYDNNGLFHVNWGWGGNADGHYASTALEPVTQGAGSTGRQYNFMQNCVMGIQPNTGSGRMAPLVGYCTVFEPMPGSEQVTLGDVAKLNIRHRMSSYKYWDKMYVVTVVYDESETSIKGFSSYSDFTDRDDYVITSYYWRDGLSYRPATNLADGRYHLKWCYSTDEWATYVPCLTPVGHPGYILMEVGNGLAKFSVPSGLQGDVDGNGSVEGTDLNILINIILGKDNAANYDGRANVDGQGDVDGSDINALINILLGK